MTDSTGDMFANLVDKYLRRGLHKGMHSLFMSIRNLYSDPVKVRERKREGGEGGEGDGERERERERKRELYSFFVCRSK